MDVGLLLDRTYASAVSKKCKCSTMTDTAYGLQKYDQLLAEIRRMIDHRVHGYTGAVDFDDEMWKDLGAHEKRMKDQVELIKNAKSEVLLHSEIRIADSIYEETRSCLLKFQK